MASASPRRRQLLELLGVEFTVLVSQFEESSLEHLTDGRVYVQQAALCKAQEVAQRQAGWILGVDTDVVAPEGTILGKPADSNEATQMLRALSGKTHSVFSGVALLTVAAPGEIIAQELLVVETRVTMATLPEEAIAAYVATGEPLDKAGGYGIQGGAMPFVTHIDGDPSNVIGLPLWSVAELFSRAKIPLWRNPGSIPMS
ncbi:Maf family protein [Armatimonas sp.]|uniref:Maf family protein n=1 Tax=Armatimonas sp. TaxID=1872638 RepID=UPI003751BF20